MNAHKKTDDEIDRVQRHLAAFYIIAQRSITKKLKAFAATLKEADALYDNIGKAKTEAEKRSAESAYRLFFAKLTKTPEYKELSKSVADEMTSVNQQAAKYINDNTPAVYAMNYNAVGQGLQKDLNGYSFQPVTTAEAAQYGNVQKQTVDAKTDKAWNAKTLVKSVIAGAVVGKAVDVIFGDTVRRIISNNRSSANRQASDMMTSAENLGRIDSMWRANDEGWQVKKRWVATLDNRTRDTHILYDGYDPEPLDFEYNDGLKQPLDPDCSDLGEICNCRCRITYDFGFNRNANRAAREGEVTGSYWNDRSFGGTSTVRVDQMTYEEWQRWRSR